MKRKLNVVGKHLKQLREARGLTQTELAARCGALGWDIDKFIIYRIEAQSRGVFAEEMVLLARALKQDVRDLFPRAFNTAELVASVNKPVRGGK